MKYLKYLILALPFFGVSVASAQFTQSPNQGQIDPDCSVDQFISRIGLSELFYVTHANMQARMGDIKKCSVGFYPSKCVSDFKLKIDNFNKFHSGEKDFPAGGRTLDRVRYLVEVSSQSLNFIYKTKEGKFSELTDERGNSVNLQSFPNYIKWAQQACELSSASDEDFDKKVSEMLQMDTHFLKRRKVMQDACIEAIPEGANRLVESEKCRETYRTD